MSGAQSATHLRLSQMHNSENFSSSGGQALTARSKAKNTKTRTEVRFEGGKRVVYTITETETQEKVQHTKPEVILAQKFSRELD